MATDIVALALDQSPRGTGWAIGRPNGPKPVFGVYRLPVWGDDEAERLDQYHRWLTALVLDYRVTAIYFEAPYLPRHNDVHAIIPQISVNAIIALVAGQQKIPVAQVMINEWRKWVFGYSKHVGLKGDAARQEWKRMALALQVKRGHMVTDHNAAEALCILEFALSDADHGHHHTAAIRHRRTELSVWTGSRQ